MNDWHDETERWEWECVAAGVDWYLPWVTARDLGYGPYLLDVEVSHKLTADTYGNEDAAPVVRAIRRIVRADGEPLGRKPLPLDLENIATGAVVGAAVGVRVARGDGSYSTGHWPATVDVVRRVIGSHRQMTWDQPRREFLRSQWQAGRTHAELASALVTTKERVKAQLARERKQYGEDRVRKGDPGRPRKGNT